MTDIVSEERRSYIMSRIRSKDTKPELLVRRFLWSKGFRYRINVKNLSGSPDIVFRKYKLAIFINGCFWHSHQDCNISKIPKSKTEWWKDKLQKNKDRDILNYQNLKNQGWRVYVIWECQLRPSLRQKTLETLIQEINKE